MELHEIEKQAKALMVAHGVGVLPFEFDNGKRRIGACHFKRIGTTVLPTKITLSRHFAAILTPEELHDTMLHEIAHALAGHAAGHGPVWRNAIRKLGGKAERCKATAASPERAVEGTCPKCGKVVSKMHRLPLRVYFHNICGKAYPLTWTKNGAMLSLSQMPTRYQSEYRRSFS